MKSDCVTVCFSSSFGVMSFGRNVQDEETGEDNWTKISEI
jgi:hypothetical protein